MIRLATSGFVTVLALGAPAVALAGPEHPIAAQVARSAPTPKAPTAASTAEQAGYARREQQDPRAARYEGGTMVVISLSGGALLVAFILLILLI
jgi:hypothetical protein